jgi:thioredoxin 2
MRRFDVQGIPTLVLLDRGRVLARQTGAAPEAALARWMERALGTASRSTAGG